MEDWNSKSSHNHDADHNKNQTQDQNNNGNIGREEASDNKFDQNPAERGQFGTTAEKGSGALDQQPQAYTDNEGLARERERGQEGYNQTENSGVYGRSQREIDNNWAQGTEGSPGEGYQDDYTSGRKNVPSENIGSTSDEAGLTDKYEGQPGNFADRNADQQIEPPHQITNRPRRDDDLSEDDRAKDELI